MIRMDQLAKGQISVEYNSEASNGWYIYLDILEVGSVMNSDGESGAEGLLTEHHFV